MMHKSSRERALLKQAANQFYDFEKGPLPSEPSLKLTPREDQVLLALYKWDRCEGSLQTKRLIDAISDMTKDNSENKDAILEIVKKSVCDKIQSRILNHQQPESNGDDLFTTFNDNIIPSKLEDQLKIIEVIDESFNQEEWLEGVLTLLSESARKNESSLSHQEKIKCYERHIKIYEIFEKLKISQPIVGTPSASKEKIIIYGKLREVAKTKREEIIRAKLSVCEEIKRAELSVHLEGLRTKLTERATELERCELITRTLTELNEQERNLAARTRTQTYPISLRMSSRAKDHEKGNMEDLMTKIAMLNSELLRLDVGIRLLDPTLLTSSHDHEKKLKAFEEKLNSCGKRIEAITDTTYETFTTNEELINQLDKHLMLQATQLIERSKKKFMQESLNAGDKANLFEESTVQLLGEINKCVLPFRTVINDQNQCLKEEAHLIKLQQQIMDFCKSKEIPLEPIDTLKDYFKIYTDIKTKELLDWISEAVRKLSNIEESIKSMLLEIPDSLDPLRTGGTQLKDHLDDAIHLLIEKKADIIDDFHHDQLTMEKLNEQKLATKQIFCGLQENIHKNSITGPLQTNNVTDSYNIFRIFGMFLNAICSFFSMCVSNTRTSTGLTER